GPAARNFGLDVDQTAAILAIFAENGIKGSEAGTQLRSMLLNMTRPTEAVQGAWNALGVSFYDAAGAARPLGEVIADLDKALDPLPAEQQNEIMTTLAGSYGILGLTALRSGMSIEQMQATMMGQADAATVAAKMMDTFSGRLESLKGSIETLMIEALTPFMDDVLKPLLEQATMVVNKITEWAKAHPGLVKAIAGLVSVSAALSVGLIGLGIGISSVGTGLVAISKLAVMFSGLLSGPLLIAIGAVVAAIAAWRMDLFGIRTALEPVITTFEQFIGALMKGLPPMQALRYLLYRLFGPETGAMAVNTMLSIVDGVRSLVSDIRSYLLGLVKSFRYVQEIGGSAWDALRLVFGFFVADLGRVLGVSEEVTNRIINVFYHLSWRIQNALTPIVSRVMTVVQVIRDTFSSLLGGQSPVMALTAALFRLFPPATAIKIIAGVKGVVDDIMVAFNRLRSAVGDLFGELGTFIGKALQGLSKIVSKALGKIDLKEIVKIGSVLLSLTSPLGILKLLFETIFQTSIFDAFVSGLERVSEFLSRLNSGQSLSQALGIDGTAMEGALSRVGDALNGFIGFITGTVIPGLQTLGVWFISEGLPAAIDFVTGTVLPTLLEVFTNIITFVQHSVIPGLQSLADWFITDALPAVVDFVQGTVIPAVEGFFKILGDVWAFVGPVLEKLAQWFIQDALPAVVGFITGTVVPAIQTLVDRLVTFWEAIRPGVEAFVNWVVTEGLPLVVKFFNETITPVIQTFIDILVGIWDAVSPALTDLFNWFMTNGLPEIQRIIENVVQPVLETFIDIIATIWNVVQPALADLFKWFTETGLPVIQGAIDDVSEVWETLSSAFSGIWDSVKTGIEAFKTGINEAFNWIKTNVINPIIARINEFITLINNLGSGLGINIGLIGTEGMSLPELAAGISYVPRDMIAMIHQGEAVLTPEQNRARMDGEGQSGGTEFKFEAGSIVIQANSRAEGEEAADGFTKQMKKRVQESGWTGF
ncbi:MAG: phage tail tape measure protein, partial [Anaerolineae bacterium]|nr:phage tail tape measure protein [Anaerolineae bacterium]